MHIASVNFSKPKKNLRALSMLLPYTLAGLLGACSLTAHNAPAVAQETDYTVSVLPCETVSAPQATTVSNLIGEHLLPESIDAFLEENMTEWNIPGISVAIINDGAVTYHRALGIANTKTGEPVTNCSIFQGASITKPIFGQLVMTFVADGVLDLDRPLYEYLPNPDLAHDERYKKITARMVLTHQTGLPNWRSDNRDNKLALAFEPGTGFSYSGEAYQYLANVLQEIAGVDDAGLEEIYQARISRPAGQVQTEIVVSDALLARAASPHIDGKVVRVTSSNSYQDFGAAYGVHSEAEDFSKWLIALMNSEGLPPYAFEEYLAPQNAIVPQEEGNPLLEAKYRALGFVIYDTPLGRIYQHGGSNPGFTSMILMQPEQKWGMVFFANAHKVGDFAFELALFLNTPSE